ncbi:3-dehydroquinate synthase [Aurantibacter sp.]|uniref:3-dehydroquinate synthase n=1 Tax=Aurantibacter sp. TaxID=2807103 RepID=UPI0032672034
MESIVTDSSAVHFNEQAFTELLNHISINSYSKIFVLVDENTKIHCLPIFKNMVNFEFILLQITSGEIHKNIETCVKVWNDLSNLNADRKSLLINLGGGVLTDLGGFVASTFKRGINFINIPTTLLAMVDASVGGKTGVDLGVLKNQIGVINQPQMVLVVPNFLKTLEERQLHSGFAEMLKHGLIESEAYWQELKRVSDFENLDKLIHDSVLIKNEVVLEDPTEQNRRKTLNYGHTLGHAIESHFLEDEDKETLLHGEAIAIGMILEAYLSTVVTGLTQSSLKDISETFLSRYKKVSFTDNDIEIILSLLKYDKKNSHGNINFVLLKTIGDTQIDVKIDSELFIEAFSYYKHL